MSTEEPSSPRISLNIDKQGIAHVQLNRADKHNALDMPMFDALVTTGRQLSGMPGLRCVVLSGDGRSFCAGLDVSMFGSLLDPKASLIAQRVSGNANLVQQAAMQWRRLPVPVIAAVQGICFGGGLQLAAGADIRIVTPDARLAVLEMKWGIIPDMGGYALWRGAVRDDVLRELTYTAREFSGDEAVAWGFATWNDANPLDRAMATASTIAKQNPDAIRAAKSLANRTPEMTTDEILLAESAAQLKLIGTPNQMEAVQSQMDRRPAVFVDP
jgi:enoyl-CoA hydratase/carnithine racemase